MSKRRVVITGMGMVSPVGLSVKESWDNILAGKSGIAPITHFDTTGFSTTFGGSVKDFDVSNYLSAKDAKKMDPFIHYGIAASMEAMKDSGLEVTEENAERIGVAVARNGQCTPELDNGVDRVQQVLLVCANSYDVVTVMSHRRSDRASSKSETIYKGNGWSGLLVSIHDNKLKNVPRHIGFDHSTFRGRHAFHRIGD